MYDKKIFFKDWEIEMLSFDIVKKTVNFQASRSNYKENYIYRKEIEFIYGLEEFLTALHKLSDNYVPNNNRDELKKFLNKYNFLTAI